MPVAGNVSYRALVPVALVFLLSACALPRSGPTKDEILGKGTDTQGDAYVVNVTRNVADFEPTGVDVLNPWSKP